MGTAPMWIIVLSAVTAAMAQEGMGTLGDIRGPGCHSMGTSLNGDITQWGRHTLGHHLVGTSFIGDVTPWGCDSMGMSRSGDVTQRDVFW